MEIGDARDFLELLLIVVVFAVVARRIRVPYAIVMVIAGLLVSLIPGLPEVDLQPDVIFSVFLPLLLYWAAWHTSWLTLKRNAWSMVVLAVGLVIFTVFGVAAAAPWFLPGFDWRIGFILGAVIAPTDAIAATSIARRLKLKKQLVDIIEGESLVNDATGLLAFQLGISMLLGGRPPTVTEGLLRLLYVSVVGIAIGLVIGWVVDRVERGIDDAPIVIAITVLVPFAAYFTADAVHASGVLAVVACGLLQSWRSDEFRSARVRLEAGVVWNTLAFILNGLVFVLIGLQLRPILRGLAGMNPGSLILYVLGFSALVIALRMLWVFPAMSLESIVSNRLLRRKEPGMDARSMFLIGWASMRGVIALAAAMSLPRVLPDGRPFPQRPLIIFLTFGAIFLSLVMKGLTLPMVIRRLGLHGTAEPEVEERSARRVVTESALDVLESLRQSGDVFDDHYEHLKGRYTARLAALNDEAGDEHGTAREHAERYRDISRAMLHAERQAAVRLRSERRISDDVLRALLTELDLAEARLNPHAASAEV